MRCTGYCTAASFDIPKLFQSLSTHHSVQLFRDVVYVGITEDKIHVKDVFYFSYGVVVCWGMSEEEEQKALLSTQSFEKESGQKTLDEFTFVYGNSMKIEEDEIMLHNKNILTKLAISHGIAQSIKLITFEELIQKTIDLTRHIPAELARKGKIPLSRKEISKKMGELFMERNFINLHADILDTPEFFWDYPELEPFYRKSAHYLDVGKRVDILNKRLAIIHELLEILSAELNHQHSSRLEWTIIILIVIEVCLVILKDLFHMI
ncbi:MAG: RMD1 family protein [Rhabdochlamydiaceae bacterium]|nr:RMD1 family protein [Rhabdochlamydiaceae bacterium]